MRNLETILLVLTLAFVAGGAKAWATEVKMETAEGPYRLVFDSSRLTRAQAASAIQLNPHADVPGLDTVLEACSPKDKAYKPCGDGSFESPNFLYNAQVNVRKAIARYQRVKNLRVPPELKAVKEYFKRSGAFYAWLLKTRYEFYKDSQVFVLQQKWSDIEPEKRCALSLDRIRNAPGRGEAFKLARVDWHNCVNLAFNDKYGKYPLPEWKAFLARYKVKERLGDENSQRLDD
jgi:hypothetical protein